MASSYENLVSVLRNPGPKTEEVTSFKVKSQPRMIRISPAGDRVATIEHQSRELTLYDAATGAQPLRLDHTNIKQVWNLAWLGGGKRLVGLVTAKAERGRPGSEDWLVIWDVPTGKILRTATHPMPMNALAIAPDGRRFAEAGADKIVRIRDADTLAVQQEFRAHDGPVTALAWHPARPILATGSEDLTIRLWDLETGRRLEELRGPLAPPSEVAFSPSGHRLACAALLETTRIWEPPSLNDPPAVRKAADGWADLLAPLTPDHVEQSGHGWLMAGGAIFSSDNAWATLPLPASNLSGRSYQVRLKLRQIHPTNAFHLILPVDDRMVGFVLDGFPKSEYYSLLLVNGQGAWDLPGSVHGRQVQDAELHELEATVRIEGANATISFQFDSRPLHEWTGPTAALSLDPNWNPVPPGNLALGSFVVGWAVSEVKLKRLEK